MDILFYLHAIIAVAAMGLAMLTPQAIHALLYTVLSFLNLAISMYVLSAPLAAALEAIIYAGAIMVLFVFAVMLIRTETKQANLPSKNGRFLMSIAVVAVFLFDLTVVFQGRWTTSKMIEQPIKDIAISLVDTNGFLLEMASFVLLAGLVTAMFVGASFIKRKNQLATSRISSSSANEA